MITAVDTNVFLDVFSADPRHGPASRDALRECAAQGRLVACDVVWIEAAVHFDRPEECHERLDAMGIEFGAVDRETATIAAAIWTAYRRAGGPRDRVVADFIVGAHGAVRADQLLTRDRGFYRDRFSGLVVLDPSAPGA